MADQAYHKRDLYRDVTARILAELETGAAPWVKPWSASPGRNHPHNASSLRPYSGCNVVLLWMAAQRQGWNEPSYVTFKQALELGGNVRKGEHGTKVYFVKRLEVKDRDEDETRAPEVHRLGRHQHPNAGRNRNHAAATLTARSTVASVTASIPGATRTVVAPITISMIAAPSVWQGAIGAAAFGSATMTDANAAPLAPPPSPIRCRPPPCSLASRRHPNSCCGVNPRRRATADTFSPLS